MIDLTSVLGSPSAPETPSGTETGIPEDVLALPEFSGLLEGKPAAVLVPKGFKSPETDVIMAHSKELANAGFGFYPSADGKTSVFFNTQYLSPEDLQKADAAGKLAEIATPFEELKASFDSVTGGTPAPEAGAAPAAAPAALPAPAAPSLDKKLATARIKNVAPGSPTSGPSPGSGRILNAILKPTV